MDCCIIGIEGDVVEDELHDREEVVAEGIEGASVGRKLDLRHGL